MRDLGRAADEFHRVVVGVGESSRTSADRLDGEKRMSRIFEGDYAEEQRLASEAAFAAARILASPLVEEARRYDRRQRFCIRRAGESMCGWCLTGRHQACVKENCSCKQHNHGSEQHAAA